MRDPLLIVGLLPGFSRSPAAFSIAGPDAVGARLALVRAVVPAVRVGRAVAFAFREIDFLDLDRRGFASAGIELIDQNLQLVIVEPAHRQHRTALRNAETADDHLL